MRSQQGFTLIELIVVIVILGILAVTAAPKFINIQSDAKISVLEGLAGSIKGANNMVYGKAAIKGVESAATGTVTIDSTDDLNVVYGYAQATKADLTRILQGGASDFTFYDVPTGSVTIFISDSAPDSAPSAVTDTCSITYNAAADAATAPTFTLNYTSSGC